MPQNEEGITPGFKALSCFSFVYLVLGVSLRISIPIREITAAKAGPVLLCAQLSQVLYNRASVPKVPTL